MRTPWWHWAVAAVHLVLACVLVAAMAHRDAFIARGRLPLVCTVPDPNATEATREALRAMAPQVLDSNCGTYDLLAACLVLHAATCYAHVAYARRRGSAPWRWIEYTFSAPLVFLHTALTSGTRDVATLVLIATGSSGVMVLGALYEALVFPGGGSGGAPPPPRTPGAAEDEAGGLLQTGATTAWGVSPARAKATWFLVLHGPGWIAVGGVLGVILWNFSRGAGGAPDFVWGIVAAEAVLLPAFGFVSAAHGTTLCRRRSNPVCEDAAYAFLSLSSKVLPTCIFIASIMTP